MPRSIRNTDVARLEHELGILYFQRKLIKGRPFFRQRYLREKVATDPLAQAQVLHNLPCLPRQKKFTEAKESLDKARPGKKRAGDGSSPRLFTAAICQSSTSTGAESITTNPFTS